MQPIKYKVIWEAVAFASLGWGNLPKEPWLLLWLEGPQWFAKNCCKSENFLGVPAVWELKSSLFWTLKHLIPGVSAWKLQISGLEYNE